MTATNPTSPQPSEREEGKCYSRDEETFHDELSDVLDMLESDGELVPGAVIYEGQSAQRTAGHYLPSIDWLLEQMGERAFDDCGEHVPEDWPGAELTAAKSAELEALLRNWMDANVRVRFWSVTKVRAVEVTAEAIAEFQAPPSPQKQNSGDGNGHA